MDEERDWSAELAAARFRVSDLRREAKAFGAAIQSTTTAYIAAASDSWETRYVAEGVGELEAFVNR